MVASAFRFIIRSLWGNLALIWLRLKIFIWGSSAFEHMVFHAPAWLALKALRAHGIAIGYGIDFHGRLNLHGTYTVQGKLVVGEWCHIGPNVTLDLTDKITLEDRSTISLNAQIITHMDVGYSPLVERAYPTAHAPVIIESGAYVGAGATILMGVTIGKNSVVAAGAVVIQDVPPYTVVAGVPARPIKTIE